MAQSDQELIDRIMGRVIENPITGCWEWTGCLNHGYGFMNVNGKARNVHRVLYQLLYGTLPDWLSLDHTCHKPDWCAGGCSCPHRKCCNPAHLEPVTFAENTRRGCRGHGDLVALAAANRARAKCRNGHKYKGNTIVYDGHRICRLCAKVRKDRYRNKLRATGLRVR